MDSNTNLGWYYNRDYFYGQDLSDNKIIERGKSVKILESDETEKKYKIKNKDLTETIYELTIINPYYQHFILENSLFFKTLYPGLLIGAGYAHEVSAKGEVKLGLNFDHTTGLPIIPGSSLKGLLRSAFPQWNQDSKTSNDIKEVKTCWIESLLTKKPMEEIVYSDELKNKINTIELTIFEGIKDNHASKSKEKYYSIYERDIFFDGIIVGAGKDEHIVGLDSITPHSKNDHSYQESMLLNPIPIPFLKILPNVSIKFHFELKSNGGLLIAEKIELFKQIILTLGIGAKTNVGYGQFVESKAPIKRKPKTLQNVLPPELNNINASKVQGTIGRITEIEDELALAEFTVLGNKILKVVKKIDGFFSKRQKDNHDVQLSIGDQVIINECKYENNNFVFNIKKVNPVT
ncbi:MAG: type III-B CRISPR module RAMP protein Cmr6 [Saprospiraceae bacterium]